MAKFHIDKNGLAAECTATQRTCPRGGKHYDSMQEAQIESIRAQWGKTSDAYAKHWDENIGEVEALYGPARNKDDEEVPRALQIARQQAERDAGRELPSDAVWITNWPKQGLRINYTLDGSNDVRSVDAVGISLDAYFEYEDSRFGDEL